MAVDLDCSTSNLCIDMRGKLWGAVALCTCVADGGGGERKGPPLHDEDEHLVGGGALLRERVDGGGLVPASAQRRQPAGETRQCENGQNGPMHEHRRGRSLSRLHEVLRREEDHGGERQRHGDKVGFRDHEAHAAGRNGVGFVFKKGDRSTDSSHCREKRKHLPSTNYGFIITRRRQDDSSVSGSPTLSVPLAAEYMYKLPLHYCYFKVHVRHSPPGAAGRRANPGQSRGQS